MIKPLKTLSKIKSQLLYQLSYRGNQYAASNRHRSILFRHTQTASPIGG